MAGTYKAIGINLKGMALGESDRLLTVLTKERGLVRVVAPGARKHQSSLRGRSGLFVVNQLLIAEGRNLDKIVQAESLESFPGLSRDLQKLTAGQYLAELVLYQALSDQPQEDLFAMFMHALQQLAEAPTSDILPYLTQATFQLLTLAGVAPQVLLCCVTRQEVHPNFQDKDWQTTFHIPAGGVISAAGRGRESSSPPLTLETNSVFSYPQPRTLTENERVTGPTRAIAPHSPGRVSQGTGSYRTRVNPPVRTQLEFQLTATELAIFQQFARSSTIPLVDTLSGSLAPTQRTWFNIERILRQYAQYYLDHPIQSATLIDSCFLPL